MIKYKIKIVLVALSFFGCMQKTDFELQVPEEAEMNIKENTDMRTIISAFEQAGKETFTFNAENDLLLSAYVISSDEAGNFYKTLVVQDKPEDPLNGLEIKIDRRAYYSKYNFGRKVVLNVAGLSMERKYGKYILGFLSGGLLKDIPESLLDKHILRTGKTVEIIPRTITLEAISRPLINTFVTLEGIQFLKEDLGRSFSAEAYDRYNGERLVEQCDNLAKSYLYTSSFASFGANLLPYETFDLNVVLSHDYYSGEIVLILNDLEDLIPLAGERCDPEFFECSGESEENSEELIFYESFDQLASSRDIEKSGWQNINVNYGNGKFKKRSSNENVFLQVSAYDSKEYVMEVWLISPLIDLDNSEEEYLTFDIRSTFEEGTLLTVWLSTDYDELISEANWQQLDVKIPSGSKDGSNELFQRSDAARLNCVKGKLRLAFRYTGSDPGASTTYDLDNILIRGRSIE